MEVFNSSNSTQPGVVVLAFDNNKKLKVKFKHKMSISVILYKNKPYDDEHNHQSTSKEDAYEQPLSTVLHTTKVEDVGGMDIQNNSIDFQDFDETTPIDFTDILMDPVIESNSTISSSKDRTQRTANRSSLEKMALRNHSHGIDRDKDVDSDDDFNELSDGEAMDGDLKVELSDDLILDHHQKSVSREFIRQQSEQVMFTEEIKTNKFSCQICDKIFQSNEEVIEHGSVIISKEKCSTCREECVSKANLLLHDFLSHKDGSKVCPKCPICMVPFLDNLEVINHLKFRHTKEKVYKCCMCHEVFQDYDSFRRHLNNFRVDKACKATKRCRPHSKISQEQGGRQPVQNVKNNSGIASVLKSKQKKQSTKQTPSESFSKYTVLKTKESGCWPDLNEVVRMNRNRDHPRLSWYNCNICERVFKTSTALHSHNTQTTLVETCRQCGSRANSKAEHLLHEYTRHSEEHQKDKTCGLKGIKCPVCKEIFSNANVLNHVMEKHTEECPYICCICDMPLQNVELYTLHVQNHQNLATAYNTESSVDKLFSNKLSFKYTGNNNDEEKTVCRLCKEKFESQQDFIHHCQNKTVKKACDDCDTVTFTEAGHIVHRYLSHSSSLEDSNSLAIPPCNDSSNNISKEDKFDECSNGGPPRVKCPCCADVVDTKDLLFHVIEMHTRECPFQCCACNNEASNIDEFVDHCNYHLGKKMYDSESAQCTRCNLRFKSRQAFTDHHAIWHNKFTCSFCQISFGNTLLLEEHLHSAHKDKTKCCSFCGKLFCDAVSLAWHERHHYYQKKVPCTLCGEVLSSKRVLGFHMQTKHTDDSNLSHLQTLCTICGKMVTKSSMSTHRASHSNDRPHNCSICNKTFKHQRKVLQHVSRVHMKHIKSYVCDVCGKNCTTRYNLKIHMRIHSSVKAFSCSFCGQGFNYNQSLQAHITKRHKNGP